MLFYHNPYTELLNRFGSSEKRGVVNSMIEGKHESQKSNFISMMKLTGVVTLLIILLFSLPVSAAMIVDVESGTLAKYQDEGSPVDYTIAISGIPTQTKVLEVNTDLIASPDASLWTIDSDGVNVDGSLNSSLIKLTTKGTFPSEIILTVSGRVPVISEEVKTNGVVITKRPVHRTGFTYYQVRALDTTGNSVGAAATQTFEIKITDEENFFARANALSNANARDLVMDMYKQGLTHDAWEVLETYENLPQPMPIFIPIIIGVIGIAIGFGAGWVIKGKRCKDDDDI